MWNRSCPQSACSLYETKDNLVRKPDLEGSMGDEKNRLGEKLAAAAIAATNQWAAKRDRALLAKLRREMEERAAKDRKERRKLRAFNRILCPIDFGPSSLKALALAKQIASENDAALYVIHVCPAVIIPLGGTVATDIAAEQVARERLQEVATKEPAGVPYELLVTTGDAIERVTKVQSTLSIDLIVMGTHGRRGVPRFFLGSVAESVVRKASCPVLTMRAE